MSIRLDRGVTEVLDDLQNTEITQRKRYASPWKVIQNNNPGSIKISQVGGALSRPPVETITRNVIKNVYTNSGVEISRRPDTLQGLSAAITSREIWAATDTGTAGDDVGDEIHLPVSIRIELRVPQVLPLKEDVVVPAGETVSSILQKFINTTLGTAADRLINQLYLDLDATEDVFQS
jgi:hypothetical protein